MEESGVHPAGAARCRAVSIQIGRQAAVWDRITGGVLRRAGDLSSALGTLRLFHGRLCKCRCPPQISAFVLSLPACDWTAQMRIAAVGPPHLGFVVADADDPIPFPGTIFESSLLGP